MKFAESSHWHALIMAGGKGERFWPWSRERRPKQLLPIFGDTTMIEMTVNRLLPLIPKRRIWIVTNARQARAMSRQMPSFPKSNFIVEPVGRDSAGAVMLGCATIAAKDPAAVMSLLPADHLIRDTRLCLRVLRDCFALAKRQPILMTIGITPTAPSSAYGYIERGARIPSAGAGQTRIFKARRFLEKPDAQRARRLMASKRFYWNAGMFVWSASTIRKAFEDHSTVHARGWSALQRSPRRYLAHQKEGFRSLPKISIDYAIMEKAGNIAVAEGTFDWDDVGSWSALCAHLPGDKDGNCRRGNTLLVASQGCLVMGDKKIIATLGVRDLVIVQTADATLICHRDAAQRVKEVVQALPARFR